MPHHYAIIIHYWIWLKWNSLYFSDKIEEAQKELKDPKVAHKGMIHHIKQHSFQMQHQQEASLSPSLISEMYKLIFVFKGEWLGFFVRQLNCSVHYSNHFPRQKLVCIESRANSGILFQTYLHSASQSKPHLLVLDCICDQVLWSASALLKKVY